MGCFVVLSFSLCGMCCMYCPFQIPHNISVGFRSWLFHNPPFLLFEPFHGGFGSVLKIPVLLKLPFLV